MIAPVAASLLVLLALAPPLALLMLTCRRAFPEASASSTALAALLALALAGIALMEVPSLAPAARPLDALRWVLAAVWALCLLACWRQRGDLAREARGWVGALREARHDLGRTGRSALTLAAAAHVLVAAAGLWIWTEYQDEAAYHWPQTLQPLADGRVGKVEAPALWADSYPRGAGHLWALALGASGTDAAVRGVNACAGVVLALAALVAARRLGAGRGPALLAAGVALTTPVVSLLSLIVYNDLLAGAAVGAGLAFLLPARAGDDAGQHDAPTSPTESAAHPPPLGTSAPFLLALALAAWIKWPALAVLIALGSLRVAHAAWGWRRSRAAERRALDARPLLFAAPLLAFAAVPLARTWLSYGTPVYPLRVTILGRTLFDGPMITDALQWEAGWSWLPRLWRFWSDFGQPIDSEGPGQLGPLWLFALLPALVILLGVTLQRPRVGPALLLAAVALALALPNFHWARYSAWLLVPGAAALAHALTRVHAGDVRAALTAALLALAAANVALFWTGFWPRVAELIARADGRALLGPGRLAVARDARDPATPDEPLPATRARLAEIAPAHSLVVSALYTSPLHLHTLPPRYRVVTRPAAAFPAFAYGFDAVAHRRAALAGIAAWLEALATARAAFVVVRNDSPEADALRARPAQFTLVLDEAATGRRPGVAVFAARAP